MDEYESSIKGIARGTCVALIGIFASKVLTYLFRLISARYGAEQYGLLSLSITIMTFIVIISTLGMEKGVTRYVTYYIEKKQTNKAKGVIISAVIYPAILSISLMIVILIFSNKLQGVLFPNIESEEFIPILQIVLLTIPFHTMSKVMVGIFKAFRRPEYEVYSKNLTESVVKLILTSLFFILGISILGISIAYTISIISSTIIGYIFMRKLLKGGSFQKVKSKYITKELFQYSLPLVFMGIFVTAMTSIDTMMIGYFRTGYAVGIYNAVVPTAQLLFVLPFALLTLFVPILTGLYVKNKKDEFNRLYTSMTKWIVMCTLPITGMLVLYSKELLGILFGNEYSAGYIATIILAVGYFINFLIYASESLFLIIKKTGLLFWNYTVILGINILLNLILIPKYGIDGAAIGTSAAYVIWAIILFIESYYYFRIIPFKYSVQKIILTGTVTLLIFWAIKTIVKVENLITLLLMFLSFIFVYTLLLLLTKSLEQDDAAIMSYLKQKLNIKSGKITQNLKRFIKY